MPAVIGMLIPVYHREYKVRKCFESILSKLSLPVDTHLYVRVGFNGGPASLKDYLTVEVPRRMPVHQAAYTHYEVYDPGKNIGKPKVVNKMVADLAAKTPLDWVLSFDSDLVLVDSFLDRFLDAFKTFPADRKLGALSANQIEGCCHVLGPNPITFKSERYTYMTGPKNEGVAGGALLTTYQVWGMCGGYRAHRIYASDDGDYTEALSAHNLLMCVVKEVVVVHPHPALEDPVYFEWKRKAVQDRLSPEEAEGPYR